MQSDEVITRGGLHARTGTLGTSVKNPPSVNKNDSNKRPQSSGDAVCGGYDYQLIAGVGWMASAISGAQLVPPHELQLHSSQLQRVHLPIDIAPKLDIKCDVNIDENNAGAAQFSAVNNFCGC